MQITVLGAGAWGTAVAAAAALRHPTLLWARDPQQADALAAQHENTRYLPGVALPPALRISADLAHALAHATRPQDLLIVATPMAGLRSMLTQLAQARVTAAVMWLSKGFEAGTGCLGHEVAREVAASLRTGVLSGPSFALEVARGQPTALVAASPDVTVRDAAVRALHAGHLRIYSSEDVVGVEVGGALKNVLAIATGIGDGLGLGLNARAALITRGLAEMSRLGGALGAQPETFMGLSGLGDLVLTATGDLSRNRRVGLKLAEGLPLPRILEALGHVAEGVYTARTALARAESAGIEVPLTRAVVDVLEGRLTPAAAVQALMQREARAEH
ncbi:NAD(P)H-dependent glycerol-3-phosphate dehydrogenase [Sphaerotilus hippei]|nr:NAD(P)H-dependent glycerol-3-phosphate dehydrogenase [Sphaerotilus hippei]